MATAIPVLPAAASTGHSSTRTVQSTAANTIRLNASTTCYANYPLTITPMDSNPKVVEDPGGSTSNGYLDQWDYAGFGTDWQEWTIWDCGGGQVVIQNDYSQKCLNAVPDNYSVVQYDCAANGYTYSNNIWTISGTNRWTWIRSTTSGKCLNVAGDSTANGARMIQWGCGPYNNESFWIKRAGT